MGGGWEGDGREMSWQELAEHQDAVVVGVEAREEQRKLLELDAVHLVSSK